MSEHGSVSKQYKADLPSYRQYCELSLLFLLHFTSFHLFLYSFWHSSLFVVCVPALSTQQGALLLVGRCVQRGQDETLGGLQWIFERIQGRDKNRRPFFLGAAGAAVTVFGGQAGEAGDGVEVGLMGAESRKGAEWG